MWKKNYIRFLVCIFFVGNVPGVNAAELRWSGFGSIVGGKVVKDSDLAGGASSTYQTDPTLSRFRSAIYDRDLNFRPDTNFALQLTADLEQDLSVTTQLTARGGNSFVTEVEWLYASYYLTPKLQINAGRQRAPFYLYSDFLDLGYAYHWLRAPLNLYGEGLSVYEGISAIFQSYVDDWDYELQGYLGSGSNVTSVIGDTELNGWSGFVATVSNDWLKVRASTHVGEGWVDVSALPTPIQLMGEDNPQDFSFISVGVFADFGAYFAGSEFTFLEIDALAQSGITGATFDKRVSWMLTAGMRVNDYLLHITASGRTITLTGDANPGFNDLEQASDTMIVGVRYDFHPSAAVKMEYTSVLDKSDEVLLAGGKNLEVDTFAFGIDFVY